MSLDVGTGGSRLTYEKLGTLDYFVRTGTHITHERVQSAVRSFPVFWEGTKKKSVLTKTAKVSYVTYEVVHLLSNEFVVSRLMHPFSPWFLTRTSSPV